MALLFEQIRIDQVTQVQQVRLYNFQVVNVILRLFIYKTYSENTFSSTEIGQVV